ncbi:MAG TPA: hypothetical protein VLG92_01560 [Candidatus Saccharimonadia bacterium]|nr:hypothetical protein [Candidatus Saccharimonadia bacterium]
MSTPLRKLPKLNPVKFPSARPSISGAYVPKGGKTKSTRSVVAEMRRLSKKDIYPAK